MGAAAKTPFTWIVAIFVCGIIFGAAHWWPASTWLDYKTVNVENTLVGEPIKMTADRVIERPFMATWTVTIRVWKGEWETYPCSSSRTQLYIPETKLPEDLTLSWWTNMECTTLPVGKYKINTTWVIDLPSPMPGKRVSIDSNVFTIRP